MSTQQESPRAFKLTNSKKFFIGVITTTLILIVCLVTIIAVETTKKRPPKSQEQCNAAHEVYNASIQSSILGMYENFAVAADNAYCSTVGKEMFEKNASAVDVAISTALCNSIMNAQSMGLGGGHFMNIYIKSENMNYIIDAREVAPLNSYETMFVNNSEKSLFGGLASGIPGEILGYWEAHKIGGRLPWKKLFEPVINLCLNGFKLSNALSSALKLKESLILKNELLRQVFINPETNKVYKENDTVKMLKLGKTMQILSEHGPDAFYNGVLTGFIVSEMNENGGNVTLEDFARYKARIHKNRFQVVLDDNLRIYSAPPPSSGILVPFIIKLMKHFELKDLDSMSIDEKALFYHRLTETFKHAYSKRTFLGDEEFLDLNKLLNDLQNDTYIDLIREKIKDNQTFPISYYGSSLEKFDTGTAHISVYGPNGDAVGITSTINNYFGAKYGGKYTGILYNDIMDDFSTPGLANSFGFAPSEANYIKPGKRPLSSMCPIIVVDKNNDVRLILGASGGSKIISAVSQIAIKTLYMGVNIKEAIDSRRIHHQLSPNNLEIESGFEEEVENNLIKIGHNKKCFNFGGSTVQGIRIMDKTKFQKNIFAYSDPRKGGRPDGA
ncbi:unnamed protein product [Brachionus calyciflorus]|uniref:Gamma-glutamyltranspeptidase 1 n=1 Tax=Brachionus calyciflorus TaxID=104777 RepID=A0A813M4M5_9BILA|nr:unnamed protein product [Brachionus calyciflorus]